MKYKLNKKAFLKNNYFLLLGILLSVTVFVFVYINEQEFNVFVIFLLCYFLFFTIPALYVCIEHYLLSKNVTLEITSNEELILNNSKRIKHTEIKNIIILLAPNRINGRNFQLLPIESYSLMVIVTETEKFFISSFLEYELINIAEKINLNKIEKTLTIFPSICLYKKLYKNRQFL